MITGVEIKRKIVHLATLVVPLGYALTSEETVLGFLVPFFICFLSVDLLRHFIPWLASLFRKYFFGEFSERKRGRPLWVRLIFSSQRF